MINRMTRMAVIAMMVLTLTACSPFKPAQRTSPAGDLPRTYSLYQAGERTPDKWWQALGDNELNNLVAAALGDNLTLAEAWARLKQARAGAVQAGAAMYPDLTFSGSSTQGRQRVDIGSGASESVVESYSIGLASSYELDLWGRVRSEREATRLQVQASRRDYDSAAMSLAAEVVDRWVNIISQRLQNDLLNGQLKANLTYLELVELRYRKGMASALDVNQQRQVVEGVRAQLPLVEAQEQLLLHQLALLLGKPAKTRLTITRTDIPAPGPLPEAGLPADLLAARPDVRAAGLRLYAADWQVAAARANRLPAIKLTVQAAYSAGSLDVLFGNWLLTLAGNLAAPILDGGRRKAEVDRTRAVVDENLAVYRRVVLTAVKEVEDALVNEDRQLQHIAALQAQIEAARGALDQASERYLAGLNDYLPVLTQLLAVQQLEVSLIRQQAQLFIYRVNLHRALGGSWMADLKPETDTGSGRKS